MSEDIVEKMNRASLAENHLQLKARLEELQAERDEAWRRAAYAEEQWGRCEAKLAKAVGALELADQAIMEVVNDLDLAGVASAFAHIRTIRTTLAELKGEK